MITSAFVTQLRDCVSDVPELHQDILQGDGASTVYTTKYKPILEGSAIIRVGGVALVEGISSGYTLDDRTGIIDLNAATSSEIEARYKEVKFTDKQWVDAIARTIQGLGDQIFKTVIRSTSGITISAGVQSYDCPSNCIQVTQFLQSSDGSISGDFSKPYVNTRYDRGSNKLIVGDKPSKAAYTQLSYKRSIESPTGMASVLDIEDRWIPLIEQGAKARYFGAQAAKIAQQGNANTEEGLLKTNGLRAIAKDAASAYEILRRRTKPVSPASLNAFNIPASGPVS